MMPGMCFMNLYFAIGVLLWMHASKEVSWQLSGFLWGVNLVALLLMYNLGWAWKRVV
jgi:hypothetical protein